MSQVTSPTNLTSNKSFFSIFILIVAISTLGQQFVGGEAINGDAISPYKWLGKEKLDHQFPGFGAAGRPEYYEDDQVVDGRGAHIPIQMLIHEKRGMFDLGTGRGYSGFQAMRGNLGLAFASPGSHGKKRK